jgi:hypothetical protein
LFAAGVQLCAACVIAQCLGLFAAVFTSPVFTAQGDDDISLDFDEGAVLARALQPKGPQVEHRQQVLPGQTHDLYLTHEQLVEIYQAGSDFLLAHLGVK